MSPEGPHDASIQFSNDATLVEIEVVALASGAKSTGQSTATRQEVATNKAITEAVLSLPYEARAELVETIIESLHAEIDPARKEAWVREAERRLEACDRGEMKSYTREEVMAKFRRGS